MNGGAFSFKEIQGRPLCVILHEKALEVMRLLDFWFLPLAWTIGATGSLVDFYTVVSMGIKMKDENLEQTDIDFATRS